MKYLIIILLFVSCTKEKQQAPILEKDNFGVQLSNAKRPHQTFPALSINKPEQTSGTVINVILLDFNGYHVTGTDWNIDDVPFDCDYSGLNPQEQQQIVDSVQKDFKYQYNTITTDENL